MADWESKEVLGKVKITVGLGGHELQRTSLHFFSSRRLKCQMPLGSNEGQVGRYNRGQSSAIKSRAELYVRGTEGNYKADSRTLLIL